jgi:tripartite-type tricarboxylate transporter receptor subunit TctC
MNWIAGIFTLLILVAPFSSGAQSYPVKPIKVVVPYAAGGNMEQWRPTLEKVGQILGQPLIVDNRPGAGGNIGSEFVAKSLPDGYTVVIGTMGTHAINQNVYAKMPFDAIKDFTPVIFLAVMPNVMAINPRTPANSVTEFIQYARSHQGKLNFGSPGNGSSAHLTGELFKQATGLDMQHVPYKGSAPVIIDLLAGRLDVVFDNLPLPLQSIRAGKLRALAVTSSRRANPLPDIPTLAEAGVAGFDVSPWYGIFGPAGMPAESTQKLNVAFNEAIRTPSIGGQLTNEGWTLMGGTPEDLAAKVRDDVQRWGKVAKAAHVVID